MENQQSSSLNVRSDLKRKMRYRSLIKAIFYTSLILQWIGFAFYLSEGAISYRMGEAFLDAFSPLLILFSLAWFCLLHFYVQKGLETLYQVSPEGILVTRGLSKMNYLFSEIQSVDFPRSPFTKWLLSGFYRIRMKSGEQMILSIGLERSEYILELLVASRPDLVVKEEIQQIRVRALLMDHQWGFLQDTVRFHPLDLTSKIFIWPLAQTVFWSFFSSQALQEDAKPIQKFMIFLIVAVMTFVFTSLINAWVLLRAEKKRLHKDPNAVKRDLPEEASLRKKSDLLFWSLAVVTYVVILSLAT